MKNVKPAWATAPTTPLFSEVANSTYDSLINNFYCRELQKFLGSGILVCYESGCIFACGM